ncbi:hypothetical protein FB446DRAFT_744334 [Lentinula raphanica]|nr:hypothetical protein FB446DRAFT_744334 [Lentinula raphanica]
MTLFPFYAVYAHLLLLAYAVPVPRPMDDSEDHKFTVTYYPYGEPKPPHWVLGDGGELWRDKHRSDWGPRIPSWYRQADRKVFDTLIDIKPADYGPVFLLPKTRGVAGSMQIPRYQDHDQKVHEGQDMTLLVMRAVPRSHPSASSHPVLADAVYHQVNVLKHTNQLLEAGHLPSGAAAMIIYGKAGKPLQEIDFYNKADSSKQFSLQKALEDMACEEAVRIAKEYGVLYTGSPLLDRRTLVAISDGQITSVLLTGWSDYAFVEKDAPKEEMMKFCRAMCEYKATFTPPPLPPPRS